MPLKGLVLSGLVPPGSCRAFCTSASEPARLWSLELVSERTFLARLPPWTLCCPPELP